MSAKPEEGSMVDPHELQRKEEGEQTQLSKIANALECMAKVVSGIGITLVTVKESIDNNTKQLKVTEEALNSLVTLLAVGKKVDGEPTATKPIGIVSHVHVGTTPAISPEPTPSQPSQTTLPPPLQVNSQLDNVKGMFPTELEMLLNFEEKGDYIAIKPRQFLGSENFAKIASAVRGAGGEYVSAGKDSHFRVSKSKVK